MPAAALLGVVGTIAPASPATVAFHAEPGTVGLGDPVFPLDGNGGYDVRRYTLDFDWQAPRTPFPTVTTVDAVATRGLSRFDLDFAGNTLHTVTVDGAPADSARKGDKLIITPRSPIRPGRHFRVKVAYTADPTQLRHRDDAIEDYGWIPTPDGTVGYPQPNGARMIFPCNDHPSLRAPITFHLTAPRGLTAVANGTLTDRSDVGPDRVRWTYDSGEALSTQLVQLAVGRFTVLEGTGPHGLPLRDVVPTALAGQVERYRRLTPDHLAWLEQRLGPYPFDVYGILVGDTDLGVALETQTISLFPKADLTGDQVAAERNMVHELAHQWFGDSVSPARWPDLWLSEGHARFYERLYSQEHGGADFEGR